MKLPVLVICLCPLAIDAVDPERGLLLGVAVAACLLFAATGEALLRPYMAPAFCLPLRFLLCGLAVFLFRLASMLYFYPLAHNLSSLSLAGVVAAIILLINDDSGNNGWKMRGSQALAAMAWLAVLGAVRGLGAYGSWSVTPGASPLAGPLPLLAGPSGALLLSVALLLCAHVIHQAWTTEGGSMDDRTREPKHTGDR